MGEDSSGGGAVWALVTLLIVLVVIAALYFGGVFRQKKQIDVNIKPGVVLVIPGGLG